MNKVISVGSIIPVDKSFMAEPLYCTAPLGVDVILVFRMCPLLTEDGSPDSGGGSGGGGSNWCNLM